jgi:hypothetical protein
MRSDVIHLNSTFPDSRHALLVALLGAEEIDVGEWHSRPVDHPLLVTKEVLDAVFEFKVPREVEALQEMMKPNLPWAEEHFWERVSGEPLNPPPSHKLWPWAHQQHQTIEDEQFSHTYPERYWPIFANAGGTCADSQRVIAVPIVGIRFQYGDLGDVVRLLRKNGNTRQAYLPVWFPEDTGVVHGERVPCSLGYHFMIRNGQLSCRYFLRSCDFARHFNDDIYMTARLVQWVAAQLPGVQVGRLMVWIGSLHIMKGDVAKLQLELAQAEQ